MFFSARFLLLTLASLRSLSWAAISDDASKVLPLTTIYTPPSSYKIPRTLYARTLLTSDKTLLATWEDYGPEPPYFPIYQSRDAGRTWSEIGRVKDQKWGWGLRYQPFLYELPVEYGGYPAGTILAAGSAIPEDLSATQLELYASTDKGYVKGNVDCQRVLTNYIDGHGTSYLTSQEVAGQYRITTRHQSGNLS